MRVDFSEKIAIDVGVKEALTYEILKKLGADKKEIEVSKKDFVERMPYLGTSMSIFNFLKRLEEKGWIASFTEREFSRSKVTTTYRIIRDEH